ncbi:uncharacterized protein STEHIDRAFT_124468 [Stereum hirsutum FP-91666 SS1]|uniref:uncharacterized protein n=1 Tax=Stereum hirsutum (strain FP-91666) TaxID=721885 RepID=UPI00044499BF|nr:uncharacterized protein STEHIDRAFT_124468 [Stereum hirsutum FP-91666 SS1]EIM82284.1 hypothetical protein STEHIDRAFT_124468 [Stereum hirsutum FP-91666 SS1]
MSTLFTSVRGNPPEEHRVRFYLGKVAEDKRDDLRRKIEEHGGRIIPTQPSPGNIYRDFKKAYVVLVEHDQLPAMKRLYNSSCNVWAEMSNFVDYCIQTRKYKHAPDYANDQSTRVAFTPEDERNLVNWIALRMPYPEHPRMGDKEYQDLCKYASTNHNQWAKRHPWRSWRERYRAHQERLDQDIADVVAKYPPDTHAKGMAPMTGQKGRSRRGRRELHRESDEEYIEGVYDNTMATENEPQPHTRQRPSRRQHIAPRDNRNGRHNDTMPEAEEEEEQEQEEQEQEGREQEVEVEGQEEGQESEQVEEHDQDEEYEQNEEHEAEHEHEQAPVQASLKRRARGSERSDGEQPRRPQYAHVDLRDDAGAPPEKRRRVSQPMAHETPPQSKNEKDQDDGQTDHIAHEFELGPGQGLQTPYIDEEDEEDELADDDQDMDDDGPGEYDENVVFESGDDGAEEPFYQVAEDHDANMDQIAAMLDGQLPIEDQEMYDQEEIEQDDHEEIEEEPEQVVQVTAASRRRAAAQVEVVVEKKGKGRAKSHRSRFANVVDAEPPYRNTRSRSHSVEPTVQQTAHSGKSTDVVAKMQPIDENGLEGQAEDIGSEDDSDEVHGIIDGPNAERQQSLSLSDDDLQTSHRLSTSTRLPPVSPLDESDEEYLPDSKTLIRDVLSSPIHDERGISSALPYTKMATTIRRSSATSGTDGR